MAGQDETYRQAIQECGAAVLRLTRGYEADAELRRDLLQDIHAALWRSLIDFRGQCSLRTWTFRVAHNIASTHVKQQRRLRRDRLASLEELSEIPGGDNPERNASDRQALEVLSELIRSLAQPDQQVILLYLEDMDAGAISEITGLTPTTVATKIHRVKALLTRRFQEGAR
jgi:RNA polymerase sigma factor (sigma-70 family)